MKQSKMVNYAGKYVLPVRVANALNNYYWNNTRKMSCLKQEGLIIKKYKSNGRDSAYNVHGLGQLGLEYLDKELGTDYSIAEKRFCPHCGGEL